MKVQIYLNEARNHFDGFDPFRAALRLAVEFEIDAERPHTFDGADEMYTEILSRIYTQLNVGGDVYPAEPYTFEYRKAGNRSLSVGDLVVLSYEGHPLYRTSTAYSVEKVGWTVRSMMAVKRGLARFGDVAGPFIPVPRHDLAVDDGGMFRTVRPSSYRYLPEPEWVK